MKILIIGGTGILSSAVVDCSIKKGYEVTMINRGYHNAFVNHNAKVIICDVNDEVQVKNGIRNLYFDVVVDFIVYNQNQIQKSLELFGKIAKQYIFISSGAVYKSANDKIYEETDETPESLWQYSVNKDLCEKFLRQYCMSNQINYTIVRPGVNYGNTRIPPYGVYPKIGMHGTIVARILAGKPIITWNNGQNRLQLTRVEDFAKGLVGLFGEERAYNEAFNVAGDYVYSWSQVLDVLENLLDIHVLRENLPVDFYANELDGDEREMFLGDRCHDRIYSNKKLKSIVTDFSSSIDLTEGIKMTLDWYRNNKGYDYAWDANQDRIIHNYNKNYQAKYSFYSNDGIINFLAGLCTYKIEYYKKIKIYALFWRCVRKFIYKPIKRIIK